MTAPNVCKLCGAVTKKKPAPPAMKKSKAVALFGNSAASLARAVGLSRSRISQWPENLTQKQSDLVIGAALRLGKINHCDAGLQIHRAAG